MSTTIGYPTAPQAALKAEFVGRSVKNVEAPAVVVDAAVVRKNCKYMLDTVKTLGLQFRAHVKTHKTIEATILQVGHDSNDIRLICSTIAEAEFLLPWLLESRAAGKKVNVIYGLPVAPSRIHRLARLAHALGPGSVTFLVDNPEQVEYLASFAANDTAAWPGRMLIMIKVDVGEHRAGIHSASSVFTRIAVKAADLPAINIAGIYTHMGHSYSSSSPIEALNYLKTELTEALAGAETLLPHVRAQTNDSKLIVTIGATPTATATQNVFSSNEGKEIKDLIESAKQQFELEIHAGVYPFLDMQQLAAAARPTSIDGQSRLRTNDIGLRVLVEVASAYEDREKPEALVAAGSIVLGREPCKSYPGWGVVTPWRESATSDGELEGFYDPVGEKVGWIVGRISQEHGILTWEGPPIGVRQLTIGEKVMIWPNHACMAGPSFGWYYVVDSDLGEADQIVDIWVRCRGW